MPTVSTIIPTYNQAGTLSRAIDSVLAQTYEDLELFVVDDGSTDHTEEVVAGYDDPRVTYVAHETNRGASVARNTGIERSSGKYVAFLDSDDRWLPEKLERQVAVLEERDDEWVAVYCDARFELSGPASRLRTYVGGVLADGHETSRREGGEELVSDVLLDRLHTHAGSSLLVRRPAVEAVDGFDESFPRFQDPEFLIRLLEVGRLAHVDEELLVRYDPDRTPPAEVVAEADEHFLSTFDEHVARAQRRGHDVVGAHHFALAKHFFRDGDFRTGVRYLRSATVDDLRLYPGLLWAASVGAYTAVRDATR